MGILQKTYVAKTKVEYFKQHLNIVQAVLPISLTKKEIDILANFMALEGKDAVFPFVGKSRKKVREQVGMSVASLGNYLSVLKDKEAIIEDEDGDLYINPILIAELPTQGYQFKIQYNE